MNLIDYRVNLRIAGRNAMDPSHYTNAFIDEALARLFANFLRKTRLAKTTVTNVAFTTASNAADLSALTGFMKDRVESIRVNVDGNYTRVDRELEDVGIAAVLDHLADRSSTGTPCEVGFSDATTAKFYPAAQYDGTLTVRYAKLLVPWTLGTMGAYSSSIQYVPGDVVSSGGNLYRAKTTNTNSAVGTAADWDALGTGTLTAPASVTVPIPDSLIPELIGIGGPAFLQFRDPENQSANSSDVRAYLDFVRECSGIGSISGNVIVRERPSCRR